MKLKKKITKRKRKSKSLYFGKEAHSAIVDYQNEDNREKKEIIYISRIKQSFDKLSENLIFIHGFARDKEHFHILKSDCVSFLYETLEKFELKQNQIALLVQ